MELSIDVLKDQIPYYLTQEAKENLVKALKQFPRPTPYYINLYQKDILQGDGWTGFGVINYETGERKFVKGIIFTNSCDIDPANKRDFPPKLIFAPIIKLNRYATLLSQHKVSQGSIDEKLRAIREQSITTLFYLPQGSGLDEEYIALLDDVHTLPYQAFSNQQNKVKLFTLSQVGFYLFLLKLSVHFCRFHENISRN